MTEERILVVDDNQEITEFLRDAVLQPLNYKVSCARDGKQGLEKALHEKPDLILLDFNLPELSGIDVLEALRQNDCQSPVILMTSVGSENVAVRAFRLGVRDYIIKPFDVDELTSTIERTLEEGRWHRERERLTAQVRDANRELARRMRELYTLQTIGRSVASAITKAKLLRRVCDAAIHLAGADASALFLLDKSSGNLHMEAFQHDDNYQHTFQTEITDSHAQEVLRRGRFLFLSGEKAPSSFISQLGHAPHSLFYVPVKLGGRAIGVLGVAYLQEEQIQQAEMQNRLTTLADYVSIALRNAQLVENTHRRADQLSTLNRIAMKVTSSLDMDEVTLAVVRSVNEILRVEAGSLALLDEEKGDIYFKITLQGNTEKLSPHRLKVGQGILGKVVETGQPIRVNNVKDDPRFYPHIDRAIGFQTHSILCVPLTIPGKVIGAIEVINKLDDYAPGGMGKFTDEDEELLHAAAAFVAMAVENARLYEAMRDTVATQTVQDTVVTLSHYVNNPLQSLMGAAYLLRNSDEMEDDLTQTAEMIEKGSQEIAVVISVLQSITSPESTVYLGDIQMLDIEKELQSRLSAISQ